MKTLLLVVTIQMFVTARLQRPDITRTLHDHGYRQKISEEEVNKCLGCICEDNIKHMGVDDLSSKCYYYGGRGPFCGLYLLTEEYWNGVGKPFESDVGDFNGCARHKVCSENTMIEYLNRYGGDCNGDGKFDCQDMLWLHFQKLYHPSSDVNCREKFETKPALDHHHAPKNLTACLRRNSIPHDSPCYAES